MKSICLVKEILFHSFDFFIEAREFILKKNPRWLSFEMVGERVEPQEPTRNPCNTEEYL